MNKLGKPMEVGSRLGDYEIRELLGAGGMGRVYRARDHKLGRDVAIKLLLGELAGDPRFLARFEREAKVLASINHPNIATIYAFDDREKPPYLVLEFLEGETLERRLRRGKLPADEALRVVVPITAALEAAHENDIVHRDLKPSNVMLCAQRRVKVLDFGIAKSSRSATTDTVNATDQADLTATGALIGTAPYMSPEQIRGLPVDRRSDVWAFGCVLFEVLSGGGAFARETVADTLAAILEYEPPWQLLPEPLPATIVPLLHRCLNKDVERRPRDLRDVRLELEDALGQLVARPDVSAPAPATPTGEVSAAADRPHVEPPRSEDPLGQGQRRRLAVLTTAVSGYGAMVEHLAPGDVEATLAAVREVAEQVVREHGGTVNRSANEEIIALFGLPTAHEDDPLRAIRAALALHALVGPILAPVEEGAGEPVHLHSAVHAGTAIVRPTDGEKEPYAVAGAPLLLADRLRAEAAAGEILISADCRRAAAPFIEADRQSPITMRGTDEEVVPYRVVGESGHRSRLEGTAQLDLTCYAGREHELNELRSAFDEARRGGGQLLVIEGEAGVGKSRLLYEFCHGDACHDVFLVQGRCRSDGTGIPYLPFVEALRGLLEMPTDGSPVDPEEVVARIVAIDAELEHFAPLYLHLLSLKSESRELPGHLQGDNFRIAMLEAIAALLTLPAQEQPVVLLLEDWHWTDDASHEVLRQLGSVVAACAMLLVVTVRPERELDWGRAAEHRRLRLEPLGAEASVEIIKSVLGVESFPADLAELIHTRTGGNPFFLEELCRSLREDGVITLEGGQAGLTGTVDRVHLPDTVQAVILTRLDRLESDSRATIRLSSVIGREFGRRILEATLPSTIDMHAALEELKHAGVLQQIAIVPEAMYRFKHALTREVAYDSLLQHQRRRLHGEVGDAIERLYGDRVDEHAASLAHHFAAAERWERAIDYGRRSAHNAGELQRFAEVLTNLEAVCEWIEQLPPDAPARDQRVAILLKMERACETLGRRSQQQEIIDELNVTLEPAGPSAELAETRLRQGELWTLLGRFENADTPLNEAVDLSRRIGDRELERAAMRGLGFLRWQQERYEEAVESNTRALEISRSLGEEINAGRDLANLASVLRSAGEPKKSISYMKEALELTDVVNDPGSHGYLLNILGKVYRDLGDDDSALEVIQAAHDICEETRLHVGLCFHLSTLATIYLTRGDTKEALERYERMAMVSRNINYAEGLSIATRRLAEVLMSLDQHDEALPYLEENAVLSARLHDQEGEALSWIRIAEAHERLGESEEAAAAWSRVRRLREETRDFKGEIEALEGLARARRRHDATAALDHYNDALRLAGGVDDKSKQGELLNAMAITDWRQGNYPTALQYYERALGLFEQLDDQVHEGLILNSIAVTLKDAGDLTAAMVRAEDALKTNRKTGQRQLEGHSLAVLGDVYFDLGDLDAALERYQASLQVRREIGDRRGEGWMLQRLSRACSAKGLSELASSYAAEAKSLAAEQGDAELEAACEESGAI